MKKPSDNICHQLLKHLVDRANRTLSTTTPPPQYTTNPSSTLRIPIMYAATMSTDEAYGWEEPAEPSTSAIYITIDNSITIIGDKNSVTTNLTSEDNDAEQDREQMSKLALTVVDALKAQCLTEESGRQGHIVVHLMRGVTIHGAENRFAVAYPGGSPGLDNCKDGESSRSACGTSSDSLKDEDGVEETCQPPKKRPRY